MNGSVVQINEQSFACVRPKEFSQLKLKDALFKEPWRAYQVLQDFSDEDSDNFREWDLKPLMGATLAPEDVDGDFQGLFIIAAQLVTAGAAPQPCYLDLVLPERIAEHHFLRVDDTVTRGRGRRVGNATVIPALGIEAFGVYTLFYAKENPSAGIEILQQALAEAYHKKDIAYDLGLLLRDEKRYEEAIAAFSIFLEEIDHGGLADMVYKERAKLYDAVGQSHKAAEDMRQFAAAFQKKYGHPPGPHEM